MLERRQKATVDTPIHANRNKYVHAQHAHPSVRQRSPQGAAYWRGRCASVYFYSARSKGRMDSDSLQWTASRTCSFPIRIPSRTWWPTRCRAGTPSPNALSRRSTCKNPNALSGHPDLSIFKATGCCIITNDLETAGHCYSASDLATAGHCYSASYLATACSCYSSLSQRRRRFQNSKRGLHKDSFAICSPYS